ncbi:hypothetical protein CI105_03465 [Candidatus Izimaplasma bacterium ZiA1]|uniref:hypothetical protein n=1 Tax=Candidatus Izimoplasma sp. ZiA1 TaxID=2024899 RepID=UPI000BAA4F7C|nr:hypothetical protein CI105_03465 [Candidatus Izimaplasma bacterium ZiA1]
MTFILMLIFVLVVPLVIFLLFAVYKSIYQKNINNSLNSGVESRMIEPLPFLATLSILALIIISSVTMSKITKLETRIEDLSNKINQLSWQNQIQMTNINDIEDLLNDFQLSELDIQKFSVTFGDFHVEDLTFDVNILINIREIVTGDNYRLLLINKETEEITNYDLNTVTLNYSNTLRLSVEHNYELVIQKVNGTSVSNLEQKDLNLKLDYDDMYFIEKMVSADGSVGRIFVPLSEYTKEDFKVKNIKVEVFEDDVLVKTTNVVTSTLGNPDVYEFEYEFKENKTYKFVVTIINNVGLVYTYDVIY